MSFPSRFERKKIHQQAESGLEHSCIISHHLLIEKAGVYKSQVVVLHGLTTAPGQEIVWHIIPRKTTSFHFYTVFGQI